MVSISNRIRKKITDNIREGRGVAGIVEDTERGINSFGTENTKEHYQQLNGRLDGRLSKSRGHGRK